VTTDTGVVRFERRGTTAVITLDRPSARNAITWAMYEQLDEALDRAAQESELRVVVIRGAGGHFAAGTDIGQFREFASDDDGVAYEQRLEGVVSKLEALPVATVAAVEGYAVGGGLALATACDVRLCTPNARFGVPIAKTVGNCLSMAMYARLVASLGASRTKSLLFTAGFIEAAEARAVGFVIDVVELDELDTRLETLCSTLAAHAPITLQVTKEAVRRIVSSTLPNGDDLVRRAYDSRDFREGVSAFIAKRPPRWEGR
jgi:enoyl-CoA hydratase/carnithine racemase